MISANILSYIYTWLYPLKAKSDVMNVFVQFQKHIGRLLDKKILCVQSDWGGEYQSLHRFLTQSGIKHQVSCPYTHQQNGSAERKHPHLVEVGLSLLSQASMPLRFWADAFQTACFLINIVPSRIISFSTPLEKLFGKQPDYQFLRSFGSACWPNLRPYNAHKLQFRSQQCMLQSYT